MAKSPEELAQTMIANMADKTGKSLPQWLKIVGKADFSKHREILNFLKQEHGVTHGFANMIAFKALEQKQPAAAPVDLIEAQYGGAKEALRPIYEALVMAIGEFGSDVEIAPKKAYVSLRRNKQFAIIQPSTKTRLDVGIILKGHKTTKRLEASGSFNSMVSHRIRLTSVDDVDPQLVKWLQKAYAAA